MEWGGWGGLLTSFVRRTSNYVTNFSNHLHGVGWGGVEWAWSGNNWCCMVCIKKLHSQHFVLTKPRFTALCKVLAMEVCKPQCHNLQKNTIEALKRIFWRKKCYFSESTKTLRWKWAVTVVKRENTQILKSIIWMCSMKEIRVSPVPYSCLQKKTCFYEHGFRSGGLLVWPCL